MVIDNVNKFMSTTSALQKMNEIRKNSTTGKWRDEIIEFFDGASVIANWGNKKAYIVSAVVFDKNPCTMVFEDSKGQ